MMFESSSSPFDEALSKPFLAEPAKKKWSLLSTSTAASTVATMIADYYDDDDSSNGDESEYYADEYEAPTILDDEEVVVFDDDDNETERALQPMNVEAAILQERHGSFQEVHKSMAQILEIQNGKSSRLSRLSLFSTLPSSCSHALCSTLLLSQLRFVGSCGMSRR